MGASGLRNFANGALDVAWLLKRRAVLMAPGGSPTALQLAMALPNAYFDSLGIPRLADQR